MTEQSLDNAQTVVQLASITMIAVPICAYAAYWVWLTQPDRPPSNGRMKYWNMAYATAAFLLLAMSF